MNIHEINAPQPPVFDLLTELRALVARADAATRGVNVMAQLTANPAPAPVAEPEKPKAATAETRKWMLGKLSVYGDDLLKYCHARSILLPTIEKLTDWPLHKVPTSKDALQQLIEDIEKWRDEIPMTWPTSPAPAVIANPSEPEQPQPVALKAEGMVKTFQTKSGEKNGKKWTRYSILIGETWYNTFDKKLVELADEYSNCTVEVTYVDEGQFGLTLKSISKTTEVTT